MESYGGEAGKWSEWLFNLLVVLGQVDVGCEKAVEKWWREK